MRKFIFFLLLFLIFGALLLVKYFGPWQTTGNRGPTISVFVVQENKTESMSLEDYLVGVLAAEMPAKFEIEALKAQAIAARTYVLKKVQLSSKLQDQDHPQALVCSDPSHCQGWLSEKEMKKKWGWFKTKEYEKKLKRAVSETQGEVATYQRSLIDPVYHSTCGGKTENAEEVWVYSIPYLKSVTCKWDQASPKFESKILIPYSELRKKSGVAIDTKSPEEFVMKALSRSSTGRIKTLAVGNKIFAATEFRRIFGLNSTNFTWKVKDEGVEFITKGYGHGVGMCQYGANGMAREGYSAEQILKYYYSGIKIEKLY